MMQWDTLVRAVRQELPVCRVAVVDGPVPLLGTRLVAGSFGATDGPAWTALPADVAGLPREALADGRPRLTQAGGLRIFAEPILPPPRLIVAGAGHVALALAPAAQAAGFRVTVIDDRAEFARPERFPGCTVICDDMAACIERLRPDATTFIVLAGRSHDKDKEALRAAVQLPSAYLGMMGSRRKVATLQRELLETGEATVWAMEKLRAPIGLDLGAETPAEIAVAIVAELIAVRRGGSGAPLAGAMRRAPEGGVPAGTLEGQQVWLALADAVERGEPCALATILSVRGSTPRSAGACMLIQKNGATVGSVGGGKWESEVRRLASETERPILIESQYLDESDMICGGTAEVFIEPVTRRHT
ncbi:MAG: adhP [Symbiobacteriaceae bacterium]|jgi:xanthine dehydrogenase accessory factor|nr:adhP [Symbiobacteriaceae bacterium]